MKKSLLIAAIAVFGLSNVNAQEISFGVKAGANFATQGGDDVDGAKMKVGFHAGVLAEFMISEKFGIQPELLYSMQGAKAEEGDYKTNLDYITLPIMAKYYITEGFSVHAGPQIGFLISAKTGDDDMVDVKDFYKSIDYGLGIGAGYALDNGLFFNARYYLGLANIQEEIEFLGQTIEPTVHNNVIQLSVGYMF